MKIDFKGILEGAWNSIFVKERVEEVAIDRLKICNECPHNSNTAQKNGYKTFRPDYHCILCGCDLHMKTRCLSCECPVKKWMPVATQSEDIEIEERLKKDNDGKDK
jgi:hypothetical protein